MAICNSGKRWHYTLLIAKVAPFRKRRALQRPVQTESAKAKADSTTEDAEGTEEEKEGDEDSSLPANSPVPYFYPR